LQLYNTDIVLPLTVLSGLLVTGAFNPYWGYCIWRFMTALSVSPDLPEAPEQGPKMLALRDDRQRRFAWLVACGDVPTHAAIGAGYPNLSEACKVRAYDLMRNEKVLDAIEECSRLVLRGLGPVAVRAARAILENPKHNFHGRMIETVLDRTGFVARTEHKVTVEHTVDTSELEALARRLAQESGIPVQRLLGTDKVIEGTVVDAKDQEANKAIERQGSGDTAATARD
jgi:hypothetical protein